MTFEKQELHPNDEKQAWHHFKGSPMQASLHNLMLDQIAKERAALETAPLDNVVAAQEKIKALKFLLGLIHRNDTPPTT